MITVKCNKPGDSGPILKVGPGVGRLPFIQSDPTDI